MEVSERTGSRSVSVFNADEHVRGRFERRGGRIERYHRPLVRLCVGVAGLTSLTGMAGAHGSHGHGGEPVTFAVVVGLPVVTGLVGGTIAIRCLGENHTDPTGHWMARALGILLVGLGLTIAISAVTTSRSPGLAGSAIGVLSALWVLRDEESTDHGRHADLTLGAVSVHRLLEGIVLGALYGSGTAVALIGTGFLAGHTALETAAIGGMYAAARPAWAVNAIVLVQGGYVAGAVIGFGVSGAIPVSVRGFTLAVVGGALLVVGAGETERSIGVGRPASNG